jgi:hypothetical protein
MASRSVTFSGFIIKQAKKETIEAFWLERTNRQSDSWIAHHDINRVMLATSVAPDGFLKL